MKAKTLMGMIACASACVSLSAFGNTTNGWFGVTVDTAITPVNCTTNGAAVSIENSKIVLDNEYATKFAIEPTDASPALSDNVVKITGTALLTPSSTNDLPVNIAEAKAGFAVGVDDQNATNFYGFANGAWVKLTGDASNADTQNTTFSLVLDYRVPNVRFYVGDTQLAAADGGATEFALASGTSYFAAIDAFGSGSITSITGSYEVAVAAYNGTKYGSIAEAKKAAGGNAANVQGISPTGEIKVAGTKAANGMDYVVCEALGLAVDDENANIAVAPVATDDDEDEITLGVSLPAGAESEAVKFVVKNGDNQETEYNNAAAIKIPLKAGTYTITPALK